MQFFSQQIIGMTAVPITGWEQNMGLKNGQTLFDLYKASSADFRSQAPAYHGLQWMSASCKMEDIAKHEMCLQ